ncbi:MAG: AsmA-like C-terminal region-containing protein [Candidatus Omnitrophica bacterium]|nr:AsmA-like C-terminal region-containing protein [Candidatus Omnitrophota bacterium]
MAIRKKILIIFIVLLILSILIGAGTYYLNSYFLPQVVKTKIAEEASKQLGALIKIGDIKFSLLKGIVIHNLSISNKKDLSPILESDRLSVSFLILPFFKERKIIFPSIGIDGARITLIRNEDNTLNIQNLIPRQAPASGKKFSSPVIVYKIDINNSKIYFLDKAVSPDTKHTLQLNNARVQFSASGVNFSLRGALQTQKQSANIKLSGKYNFKNSELKIISQIDKLDVAAYTPYLNSLPVNIKSFTLSQINTEAALLDNKVALKTTMDVKGVSLSKDKSEISDANAKINASLNIDLKNLSGFNYIVSMDTLSAKIFDPQIPKDTALENAQIKISPNVLEINAMKLKTLNTFADIKGKLENFSNPYFNFNIQSTIDIPTVKEFLKNYITLDDSISVSGKTDININVAKAKDKNEFTFKGSLNLKDASLKTKAAPYEVNSINGLINFDEKTASWSDLSFNFMDNLFKSKATIINFKSPSVDLELDSDKIDILAKINSLQNNNFDIEYLKGNFYNSRLSIGGNLSIKDQNNISANLTIKSQIDLKDLLQIPAFPVENIAQIKPEGILNADGKIKGNLKDIKSLIGIINLSSDELKFYGLSLKELRVSLTEENQQLTIPDSAAKFYNGTFSVNGMADLSKENNPFIINISANNIDLSELKLDTPMKDQELQGILAAVVILNGEINKDPLAALKGKGQFLIKDGYLWEFNPLKKVGDFLFIPRYETLVFKQAKADFVIADKKVSTDNLTLNSDIISLACEGNIDFAGNLDFEIAPYPAEQESQGTEESSGKLQNILNNEMVKLAGISVVQVTGTIQNPKISMKMVTREVVDKLKEGVKSTVGTVKDIFGSIFGGNEE